MKTAAILPLLVVATSALAQSASVPAPRAAPSSGPNGAFASMSPEGRAIATRIYSQADPRGPELASELTRLRMQRAELIMKSPVDLDALQGLMDKDESLQAERRKRSNDRLMEILRALPEEDRLVLLKSLAGPARQPR